jgi:hypothetical protein
MLLFEQVVGAVEEMLQMEAPEMAEADTLRNQTLVVEAIFLAVEVQELLLWFIHLNFQLAVVLD